MSSHQQTLLRFVTDGLHSTIDHYLAGRLPLHRLAWELRRRLDPLAELTDLRTLNRLHTHTCTVEDLGRRAAAPAAERLTTSAATAVAGLSRDGSVGNGSVCTGSARGGPAWACLARYGASAVDDEDRLVVALTGIRETLDSLLHPPSPTPGRARRPGRAGRPVAA